MTRAKILDVTESVGKLSPYEFDGTVADVIKMLKDIEKTHGPTARLSFYREVYEPYCGTPHSEFEITITRPETLEEHKTRLSEIARQEELQRIRDLELYEKLKKSLGK